jgi:coproporphyrinogen III oxidase
MNKHEISTWFQNLQDSICKAIEEADGSGKFVEETWTHTEEGGGRTRILQNGNILEKAGVNFSGVGGKLSENIVKALGLSESEFFATGVSIVIHPKSPMVPIIHMNVRYFETPEEYWFGGGIDLTPHYVVDKDAKFFHQTLKKVCDSYDAEAYAKYKTWADDYFFNKHRNETRGIGGIFFDRLNETREGKSKEHIWNFVQEVGSSFASIYTELLSRNAQKSYNEGNKHWQNVRRGRYVEFNLVYDKGTKFGFDTGGRTESILMSMPPLAEWVYQYKAEEGSEEEKTLLLLKKGISWA